MMMLLQHAMLAVAIAITPPNDRLSPDSMMVELRKGGYTILWRHASTDYSTKDAPGFPDDRTQQRNLTEQGRTINGLGDFPLKGNGFQHFAAFFSRRYRENDYLLGRLHALDRLIDIVCDAAGLDNGASEELQELKRRGLLQILSAEAPALRNSSQLIEALRQAIARSDQSAN